MTKIVYNKTRRLYQLGVGVVAAAFAIIVSSTTNYTKPNDSSTSGIIPHAHADVPGDYGVGGGGEESNATAECSGAAYLIGGVETAFDSGGGDGECFASDTPILMADGRTKPIQDISLGDMVASFVGLGTLAPGQVLQLVVTGRRRLIDIDGVKTTAPHPFLLADGTWKHAKHIISGDRLARADGSIHTVFRVSRGKVASRVYNLEVDGNGDTFIAGGFRVHNSTILCLELFRQGLFSREEIAVERRWSRAYNPFSDDDSLGTAYYTITRPLIAAARRSHYAARTLAVFIRPWIKELGYRHEGWDEGHWLGRLGVEVGVPLCKILCGRSPFSKKLLVAKEV